MYVNLPKLYSYNSNHITNLSFIHMYVCVCVYIYTHTNLSKGINF